MIMGNCIQTNNRVEKKGSKFRNVSEIILHCSATQEGKNYDVNTIREWHTSPNRSWSDIGYHWVIDINGKIMKGRDESVKGAHCEGRNAYSIGVCYIGGVEANNISKAKDTRTDKQKEALKKLLTELHERYPTATLHGHNEFSSKACPSFNVKEEKDLMDIFN